MVKRRKSNLGDELEREKIRINKTLRRLMVLLAVVLVLGGLGLLFCGDVIGVAPIYAANRLYNRYLNHAVGNSDFNLIDFVSKIIGERKKRKSN